MRKLSGLRRRAVALAAMATALGGVPAITLEHRHHWVAFLCIGLQLVLLSVAARLLVRSRRPGGPSPCDNTTSIR